MISRNQQTPKNYSSNTIYVLDVEALEVALTPILGVVIITTPASPLPTELVAITENV